MTIPHSSHNPVYELRQEVVSLQEKNGRLLDALSAARTKIEELGDQISLLSRPPMSFGTFLTFHDNDRTIDCLVGGRKMNLAVSPDVDTRGLKIGQELKLNEELVVIEAIGYGKVGSLATIEMVIDQQRALVRIHQSESRVMLISGAIAPNRLRVGELVMIDSRDSLVLDVVERPDVEHLLLEEIPDVSYDDIGGLGPQIQQIKDSVELPFEQPELYREHGLKPPKGVLLYGPPGCGKTLIAKAVATSLASKISARKGHEGVRSYFLNIKGPQLLDKYVGETERQIRDIFSRARDRAATGIPVVIFFDEMEALFRTRGSGVSSDVETTVVPQLLAEIDGVEALENVIVIGASNREDMIDPAVLRPGRLDVKVRIERPTREGSLDILSKYLTEDLPIAQSLIVQEASRASAVRTLREIAVEELFARTPHNRYMEITYASGKCETLYVSDMVSGALLSSIVDRAKTLAIKEYLTSGARGLTTDHMRRAVHEEIQASQDMTSVMSPDEWARVNARARGEKVVDVRPIRTESALSQSSETGRIIKEFNGENMELI